PDNNDQVDLNTPYLDPSGQLPALGDGQVGTFDMVEVIQRYGLSASRGAGSLNLSADIMARLFIAVLNQIHSLRKFR
ncbi:hypothetical protein, partial [Klebsiella quasipneumoniae]|uniref:hypothetical protein n=1 Tax=Klebsiella quasipneumoniae TaxID=1463165 RepID=UPI003007B63D